MTILFLFTKKKQHGGILTVCCFCSAQVGFESFHNLNLCSDSHGLKFFLILESWRHHPDPVCAPVGVHQDRNEAGTRPWVISGLEDKIIHPRRSKQKTDLIQTRVGSSVLMMTSLRLESKAKLWPLKCLLLYKVCSCFLFDPLKLSLKPQVATK